MVWSCKDNKPCYKDGKCHYAKPCANKFTSNADRIRAMSDEELAETFCNADWCEACDQVKQDGTCHAMELGGPLNKYCVAGALKWLQQPAPEEGEQNV